MRDARIGTYFTTGICFCCKQFAACYLSATMSAEPGRKAPYAADLRWRMVWQRIGMEFSCRRIAWNLNVAVGTVYHICRLFKQTGDVAPRKAPLRYELRKLQCTDELL